MTTTTWSCAYTQATDAAFRIWGKAISDALTAIGLTKTSDTGQVDWATVVKPGSSNTSAGYEIWRMNDTQQANCPIFFKIEYGAASSVTSPSLWFTVGTGSDGAGAINGGVIQARTQYNSSAGEATPRTGYACYQAGVFWLGFGMFTASAASISHGFGFSRFCDANGVADGNGGVWWATSMTSAGTTTVLWWRPTSTARTGIKMFPLPVVTGLTSYAYSTDVAVFEPVVWGDRPQRVCGLIAGLKGDWAAGSAVSINAFGSLRVFMPMTGNVSPSGTSYNTGLTEGILAVYA